MTDIGGQYESKVNEDGTFSVLNVPIFCTCKRGKAKFDRKWLDAAFSRMKEAQKEDHLAPVHVFHNEPGEPKPQAAGFMSPRRIGKMRLRGVERDAIFADLTITDEWTFERLLGKKLPYRSVEIVGGEIISLALLDSEAPFLEMPMTTVKPPDVTAVTNVDVAEPVFRVSGEPVVAFRRQGGSTLALMEAQMPDTITLASLTYDVSAEDANKPFAFKLSDGSEGHWSSIQVLLFENGKDPDDEDEEEKARTKMEEDDGGDTPPAPAPKEDTGTVDAAACAKAIADGTIQMGDFEIIKEAMEAALAQSAPEQTPANPAAPNPNAGPGDLMSHDKELAEQFGTLQGKHEALQLRLDARDQDDEAKTFARAQVERFSGRVVGPDFEERATKFYVDHGKDAADAWAKSMDDGIPKPAPSDFEAAIVDTATGTGAIVQKFSASPAVHKCAVEGAQLFKALDGRGSCTEERFIEIHLLENGHNPADFAAK